MTEIYEYDSRGRLKYHPELHARQGKRWTSEELEYLCKFHTIDSLATISLALERVQPYVYNKLWELKKSGQYEYYRNVNKYYVSVR